MNPFDLAGPEFLLFYIVLLAVVITTTVFYRRRLEAGEPSKLDLSDPYLVALLRGGGKEAIRVAVISLLDRKLLSFQSEKICLGVKAAQEMPRSPVERAILNQAGQPVEAFRLFSNTDLLEALKIYNGRLVEDQLLPDAPQNTARSRVFAISAGIIFGVGLIKLAVAIARGHSNIGFLIILMIVGTAGAVLASFPRLTEKGRVAMQDLKLLYGRRRYRPADIGSSMALETAMLAAVFGITALEGDPRAYSKALFPQAANSGSTGCGTGGGCGSGGGSCGGGGGGGCGGCGGGH